MSICDWCGKNTDTLYDVGGCSVCEECMNNDTSSMIISDDIEPTEEYFI